MKIARLLGMPTDEAAMDEILTETGELVAEVFGQLEA